MLVWCVFEGGGAGEGGRGRKGQRGASQAGRRLLAFGACLLISLAFHHLPAAARSRAVRHLHLHRR